MEDFGRGARGFHDNAGFLLEYCHYTKLEEGCEKEDWLLASGGLDIFYCLGRSLRS